MAKNPVLAKFTCPRLHGVFARERLFSLLDKQADCPVAWIAGPGGAGKTTLTAGYLAARGLKGVWYQVDAGDKDPASLFHYLGEALAQGKTRKSLLPQLGPEYLADLPGFARRFFRAFFQALPSYGVLVLDNWQEAESDLFHALLHEAFTEVPEGCRIIIVSRTEPPAEFSRLQANRSLMLLDAEQLEFNAKESRELAASYGVTDDQSVAAMREATGGWAAGLVLMLEARKRGKGRKDVQATESRQPVFAYLAEEVFKQAPANVQAFWLRTAFFPFMTVPMAEEASRSLDAGEILAEAHRHHFFTDRRLQPDPVYQYHALFREFLLAKSRECHDPDEWIELQRSAAALLEQNDQLDAAVHWYQEADDWEAIARIVLQNAQRLAIQGRTQTLLAWISILPELLLNSLPWLDFWKSVCLLYSAPSQARDLLSNCYARFTQSGDLLGRLMAAAVFIESHMLDWGDDITKLNSWMSFLEDEVGGKTLPLPREVEIRVVASLMFLLLLRKPQSPLLPGLVKRTIEFMDLPFDVNLKLTLASFIFTYHLWRGEFDLLAPIATRIAPWLDSPEAKPLMTSMCNGTSLALYHIYLGEPEIARQNARRGRDIALENGLGFLECKFLEHWALASLLEGNVNEARDLLNSAEKKLGDAKNLEKVLCLHAQVTCELWSGKPDRAEQYATEQRHLAEQVGVAVTVAWADLMMAQCAIEKNDPAKALQFLASAHVFFETMHSQIGLFAVALCESDAQWLAGDFEKSRALLLEGMEIGRRENYVIHQWWYPQQMSRLCERAFRENIEPNYVRRLVDLRGLTPQSADVEDWPWPLKIYTLGRFIVLKDGVALEFSGKAKHKQLELLKALVALGGRNVSAEKLAEALWPDAEADSAMSTLGSTLHRLRKLLGDDNAIVLEKGVLTLNDRRVWVDVWAFERVASRILGNGENLGDTQSTGIERQFLRLYQGKFLEREPEVVWSMKMREKLESRFLAAMLALGAVWEKRNQWEQAVAVYRTGLDLVNISEELHRRLMACHTQLGQKAEALSVYERCRKMLDELFQAAPSHETEALRATLCEGRTA